MWSGGAFLSVENNDSESPELLAAGAQGNLLSAVGLRIPEARVVAVSAVARTNDGTMAAGGYSTADDGRTAGFFASVDSGGATAQITRTDPFRPMRIVAASDGTF